MASRAYRLIALLALRMLICQSVATFCVAVLRFSVQRARPGWGHATVALTLCLAVPCFGDDDQRAVSFVNDVVPVLTKAGCNAGVCHAKAGNGQNGFQLSLLGFEPQEDYEHLVKEGRGRRLFPAAPENSLLLLKASGKRPHGGGVRLADDSKEYALLLNWIHQEDST